MPAVGVPYTRKRGEKFYLNFPIPADVRAHFKTASGKERTHVVAALGTGNALEGRTKALALAALWTREFAKLRQNKSATDAPHRSSESDRQDILSARQVQPVSPVAYRHLPFKFAEIANSLTRGASKIYKTTFGVSGLEWGVMALLATHPDISANNICKQVGLDKGAASRAVSRLTALGFVTPSDRQERGRQRFIRLTTEGLRLHDEILTVARQREKLLTAKLSASEVNLLVDLLGRLSSQLDAVSAYDPLLDPAFNP